MAGNSLTTWGDLFALASGHKALWRTNTPTGYTPGECVTWGEYRTLVLTGNTDSLGNPDAELIDMDEAALNATQLVRLLNGNYTETINVYYRTQGSAASTLISLPPQGSSSFSSVGVIGIRATWRNSAGVDRPGYYYTPSGNIGAVSLVLVLGGSGEDRNPYFTAQ